MASVEVQSLDGKPLDTVDLPDEIFGAAPSAGAIYFALKASQVNQRQGNASTKTRAEVHLSKRKKHRQKGTGRARAGTAGSPIRIGGGVAHGPRPHAMKEKVNRKAGRSAIRSLLSIKAKEGQVRVLEDFSLDLPKTGRMANLLKACELEDRKALLLMEGPSDTVFKSSRNLKQLCVQPVAQVSAFDVAWADTVVFTRSALTRLRTLWEAA
jgi:large subunit ribosomal protein L4